LLGAASTLALNIILGLCALRLLVLGTRYPPVYSAAGLAIIAFLGQGMLNNLFTVPATGTLLAILIGAFATGTPFTSSAWRNEAQIADQAGAHRSAAGD
jgi:hypothetical protein